MSIDASKWARTADVQKSSSKLVLLELAHLVRAYAAEWTVFASIEHLAKVTHLNRKTVIDALARLRELGAIVDTGLRAGASRCCPVYRLCPAAVPSVCAPAADAAAGDGAAYQPPGQPDPLDLDRQGALALDELAAESAPAWPTDVDEDHTAADDYTASGILDAPSDANEDANAYRLRVPTVPVAALAAGDGWSAAAEHNPATPAPPQAQPVSEASSMLAPSAPIIVPGPAPTAAPPPAWPPVRTRRPSLTKRALPPAAGAGATRLPADWALPATWRAWTHRERPHWRPEKVDAMVLTFSAYWRSKPGHAGFSEDWFASWRLWVFRERETRTGSAAWHSTWSGIVAKGRDLGLEQAPGEQEQAFRMRVHRASGVPIPA